MEYIRPTEREQFFIDSAADAMGKAEGERSAAEKNLVMAAEKARSAWQTVKRRIDHAVTSKNVAKMRAALDCLAPHIMRPPEGFNADKMMVP